jgi:hypothetical protein
VIYGKGRKGRIGYYGHGESVKLLEASLYLFNNPRFEPLKILFSILAFRMKKFFSSICAVFGMWIVVLFGSYSRNHDCMFKGENKHNIVK